MKFRSPDMTISQILAWADAWHERTGEQVAMIVFDLHLSADGGRQALAGEGLGMLRRFAAKDLAHHRT